MFRTHSGFHWGRVPLVTSLLLAMVSICAAKDYKGLPQRYQDWLQKEVVYVISNEEREAFLKLTTDDAREQFIGHFWEVRNPTPGAPNNPYREEIYRRIEYANQFFGHISHTPGWMTDMGRVYITLGPPQQKQVEIGYQKLAPMEVWFYQNSMSTAALPPFFYVVFFQKDNASEFKLYSPYSDGPERLIMGVVGPTRQQALKILTEEAGREVARVSLSLLPDEPVDFDEGMVSLQSDVMLATIRNFANNPYVKDEIAKRRRLLEEVTHRVVLGNEYLDSTVVPLRDALGETRLHYALRLKRPEDFSMGKSDKGYYYNIGVSVRVFDPKGKLIFSQERRLSRSVDAKQFEAVKGKKFGYEGSLPLPPGNYKLEFLLSNSVNHTAWRQEREVAIPDVEKQGMQVTNPVAFLAARPIPPEAAAIVPFTGGGVKFMPLAGQDLDFVAGREVSIFYQIWLPAAERKRTDRKLLVEYTFGRMGAQDTHILKDEIGLENFDDHGSLISGRKISTVDLPSGNYRMVVSVRDASPQTGTQLGSHQEKAFGSLMFRIVPSGAQPAVWDVTDGDLGREYATGVDEFKRALCYLVQGNVAEATKWLRSAFEKNPDDEQIYSALVDEYFASGAFARIIDASTRHAVTASAEDRTILHVAEAFEKTGDRRRAIEVLESALKMKPASGPLYLALSGCYQRAGDATKAADAERRGKDLLSAKPPSM